MEIVCADCGVTWQREPKRGQLPKRCPECTKQWCAEQGRLRQRKRPLERRKGSAPCAGCGKLLYGSGTSLPPGKRMCRPCRKVLRGAHATRDRPAALTRRARVVGMRQQGLSYQRIASLAGVSVPTVAADLVSAGVQVPAVRKQWTRTPHPCEDCGATTTRHSRWCATCVRVHRSENNQRNNQRKNLRRRAGGTRILSIRELAERDRWRCHLCRQRVDPAVRYPSPWSASRDHLVPVAHGGTNDPSNLALAHLRCNVRRGTRGVVQLQLVG